MDYEAFFLSHLDLIDGVIAWVTRRYHLSHADADEFASHVRLRFVDRDYEILRRFEQRSALRTYLTTVVQRLFLDWRIAQWGKWRPSSEARRLGPIAMRLEQLVKYTGLTFDEAVSVLQTNERVAETRDQLYAMFARLPVRVDRRPVDEEALATVAALGADADRTVMAQERDARAVRARHVLRRALAVLPPQDRLIVRMRFEDGLSVADIARALHLDQKPLYRRLEQILRHLREALLAGGVDHGSVADLFDSQFPDGTMVHGPPDLAAKVKSESV